VAPQKLTGRIVEKAAMTANTDQNANAELVYPVLLSGGSGTRLWPLSRTLLPKQLLPLTGDATMLQDTAQRLSGPGFAPPMVICNDAHRFIIAEQLRAIDIAPSQCVLEPIGRNTAPAAAIAALILAAESPDALLLVAPSDHLIKDAPGLRAAIGSAAKAASRGALVTFGVKPTKPHTGFGYIKGGDVLEDGACYNVARFVEKPDLETARGYLASGDYYWNSGMFLFSAQVFLDELERLNPAMLEGCRASLAEADKDLDFLRLAAAPFEALKGDSIDYAVMEHTDHAAVMPIDVGWSDLGAWGALWEIGEQDEAGNVLVGDALVHDTRNTYIRSDARLVTAVGVENLIIVATEDAVLVADRDKAEAVRHIVKALADLGRSEVDAHVRVLRPWGAFEGIKKGPGYQVKVLTVNPGAGISLQYHNQRAEHWVVVSGHARVTRDDDVMDLAPNESTYIPLRAVHQLENPGDVPLQVVEVQTGDYLGEDDIVRIEDRYGRG